MGARPAQPVPLALAPPTTDTAATYQQQSAALGRVGGVGEVRGVEDRVALAQKLGLKGFSSMGQAVLALMWPKKCCQQRGSSQRT